MFHFICLYICKSLTVETAAASHRTCVVELYWIVRFLLMFASYHRKCEMVSVLVCILPSLVSVETMSWRQFLLLPHSLLVHYLNPPAHPSA